MVDSPAVSSAGICTRETCTYVPGITYQNVRGSMFIQVKTGNRQKCITEKGYVMLFHRVEYYAL